MKKMLLAAFVLTLALPLLASDEEKAAEYLELCNSYAKEDGVSADEMDDYLKDCVKDLNESAEGEND